MNIPSKQTVEDISPGQVQLHIAVGDNEFAAKLQSQIQVIIADLVKDDIFCPPLRLIEVVSNFEEEVFRWQRELGKPENISSGHGGEVSGKVLKWGSGDYETTYAVIILPDWVGNGLVLGHPIAKGILVHECAHVYDDYYFERECGCLRIPTIKDWDGIKQYISVTLRGEFFAEALAAKYFESEQLDERLSYGEEVLRICTNSIKDEIKSYRKHGDIAKLWLISTERMSTLFNQLGRTLGFMYAMDDGRHNREFTDRVSQISNEWGTLIDQLLEEIQKSIHRETPYSLDAFDDIKKIIEQGFQIAGIYPRYTSDGELYIDVP
ncbi:hypothetical protein EV210_103365 [Anaerospora hongkongensis]|uniref:Uncharacterized protein n=1 Tax=Anaerospora hongkongensis TaxID=244830 RepID=A0A4R1Q8Z5_9FIRM|nr:hypothetical protein [Anaerospora hongkongensis]TCL38881.1 hypothetical protein EV210_103365 [Anaerospora hongkongensis]